MAPITVRVRTPGRMLRISLEPTATVAQLRAAIRADVCAVGSFRLSRVNAVRGIALAKARSALAILQEKRTAMAYAPPPLPPLSTPLN